eukprot:TRINITY_DN3056_c0_g1_i1.p1 TRINITY_DN3056_c0_g1~~TRINITY_DN3056_c0_g1_i1.p1  ORF type:complete len:270 (+),score=56.23 TRINITY_DN3056_c0_g1_i1:64-810(+)
MNKIVKTSIFVAVVMQCAWFLKRYDCANGGSIIPSSLRKPKTSMLPAAVGLAPTIPVAVVEEPVVMDGNQASPQPPALPVAPITPVVKVPIAVEKVLFFDPVSGNDVTGNGSLANPYKRLIVHGRGEVSLMGGKHVLSTPFLYPLTIGKEVLDLATLVLVDAHTDWQTVRTDRSKQLCYSMSRGDDIAGQGSWKSPFKTLKNLSGFVTIIDGDYTIHQHEIREGFALRLVIGARVTIPLPDHLKTQGR